MNPQLNAGISKVRKGHAAVIHELLRAHDGKDLQVSLSEYFRTINDPEPGPQKLPCKPYSFILFPGTVCLCVAAR